MESGLFLCGEARSVIEIKKKDGDKALICRKYQIETRLPSGRTETHDVIDWNHNRMIKVGDQLPLVPVQLGEDKFTKKFQLTIMDRGVKVHDIPEPETLVQVSESSKGKKINV